MSNDMSQMQIVEQQVRLHNALTLETLIIINIILVAIDMDHLHSRPHNCPTICAGGSTAVEQWALETLT